MFDSGITELLLVALVGLLVLGPQRLQHSARVLGRLLGKAKGWLAEVQAQVGQELPEAELKELRRDMERVRSSNVRRNLLEQVTLSEKSERADITR
ncbi:Sec-independent protein translocase protein TatB [Halopseudomonas phragmitis]|uniref:Twin arginine-targeting protein translocase TatB n=2 Tax=Pseudomonadaceae TaxID=135621 RepID=A0A1V0B5A9_9GAMM|nr:MULTISPECIES: Sec-independent protein translocase protein TatB [Pseudomonadaceae]AQZ95080.1 twin arginine-targeting protein translocase TatB [Halopseudomonas phragmitis]RHW21920.1 twin-arginine translocase subunit TatB [Pseudomonas jilinensis]